MSLRVVLTELVDVYFLFLVILDSGSVAEVKSSSLFHVILEWFIQQLGYKRSLPRLFVPQKHESAFILACEIIALSLFISSCITSLIAWIHNITLRYLVLPREDCMFEASVQRSMVGAASGPSWLCCLEDDSIQQINQFKLLYIIIMLSLIHI